MPIAKGRTALRDIALLRMRRFLFHLDQPGRLDSLLRDQRQAPGVFVLHLYDTRLEAITENMDEYALQSLMCKLDATPCRRLN